MLHCVNVILIYYINFALFLKFGISGYFYYHLLSFCSFHKADWFQELLYL